MLKKILLVFSLFLSQQEALSAAVTLDEIKARGHLRIGVFTGTRLFGYKDSEGNHKGIDIDIAHYLAKEMFQDETKVELVPTLAIDRAAALKSGKVDIVIANYSDTKRRRKAVDFAEPYVKSKVGVVASKTKNLSNVRELESHPLLVFSKTTAAQYFEENYPNIKLDQHIKVKEMYDKLKNNKELAMSNDSLILFRWLGENKDFEMKMLLGKEVFSAPAIDKDNPELLEWVNQTMKKMKEDGSLLEFYKTNMQPTYGESVNPYDVLAN